MVGWLVPLSQAQYLADPNSNAFVREEGRFVNSYEKYVDHVNEQKDVIDEVLGTHPDLIDLMFPERGYADIDQYSYQPPKLADFMVGLLLDPCQTREYDCCVNIYGTPEYGALDPVDADLRVVEKRPLATDTDVEETYDLVGEYAQPIAKLNSRRAAEQSFFDESCTGLGEPDSRCMSFRRANGPFPIDPACQDNNQVELGLVLLFLSPSRAQPFNFHSFAFHVPNFTR